MGRDTVQIQDQEIFRAIQAGKQHPFAAEDAEYLKAKLPGVRTNHHDTYEFYWISLNFGLNGPRSTDFGTLARVFSYAQQHEYHLYDFAPPRGNASRQEGLGVKCRAGDGLAMNIGSLILLSQSGSRPHRRF